MQEWSSAKRTDIRQRLEKAATAVICDVFDENEWEPLALDSSIRPLTLAAPKVAGWAFTIQGSHAFGGGADRLKLQAVDEIPEDSVAVWAGTDAQGICLFGDLIAGTMKKRGCRGAVVDGGFRDVKEIRDLGFAVYARYSSPVQSVGRWQVKAYECPVYLPGAFRKFVPVHPGDFVLADADGAVIIPRERVLTVLTRTEAILSAEEEARSLGAQGLTAMQMLEKFGHV
jgi:4-hydroxy-4-methyl-2-oxoglutarate aldolase